MLEKWATAYVDGGCRGNPGHYACAAILVMEGLQPIAKTRYLGNHGTVNEAEYGALILALNMAIEREITHLSIRSDSKLIVEQVLGTYRIKQRHLAVLHRQAETLALRIHSVGIRHIRRELNQDADQLVTACLDQITGRARRYSTK